MARARSKDNRPVYLNLFKIRLPVAGMVSLAHRASGMLMFLAIPFMVYLLDLSVRSAESFEQALTLLQQPFVMAVVLLIVWALSHHLFAGIRFLLIDADIGVDKKPATMSAWAVMLLAAIVVIIVMFWVML